MSFDLLGSAVIMPVRFKLSAACDRARPAARPPGLRLALGIAQIATAPQEKLP